MNVRGEHSAGPRSEAPKAPCCAGYITRRRCWYEQDEAHRGIRQASEQYENTLDAYAEIMRDEEVSHAKC